MTSEERPPIRLDQFLKQQGAVGTGGHAKVVIQAGEVTLNGAVETKRRKQLSPGDIVAYAGEEWRVV
ncbi:RNA-binding S4 domain-containing protein [Gimesia aquarii]|uniref:Ribosome-associated protein n=1 Tax=Gimesia aquarii TaxID=2527964 RepID=A0A517W3J4_9PLAN|nr:RNA-binding S4 domain-containing protein [Gimesia aquarii]QDT99800.1 ribosome-associated protein [Gimesia aquarii]QDU08597.1 ribosome-associated protein [Gimesia aquarii]